MRTVDDVLREVQTTPDFAGVEVNDANTKGLFNNFPLHVASVWGDCEAIDLLTKAGANINQQGEHGFTPLMEAVAQGHFEAVRALIQLGAKPIPNMDGDSPSQYARIVGYVDLAEELEKHGF